jgi:hypothetical protein
MIALVIVIIGIHRAGRCKSLALSPAASTENLAHEILGIYICEPGTHHKGLLGLFSVGCTACCGSCRFRWRSGTAECLPAG